MGNNETEKTTKHNESDITGEKEINPPTIKEGLHKKIKSGTIYSPAMRAARKAGALGISHGRR